MLYYLKKTSFMYFTGSLNNNKQNWNLKPLWFQFQFRILSKMICFCFSILNIIFCNFNPGKLDKFQNVHSVVKLAFWWSLLIVITLIEWWHFLSFISLSIELAIFKQTGLAKTAKNCFYHPTDNNIGDRIKQRKLHLIHFN